MIKSKRKNTLASTFWHSILVIPILISGCQSKSEDVQANQAKPKAIPVKLQTLESATVIESSNYVGTLEAKERVNLAPRIQGRILKIFVQEGESVRQNQAIIELEPTQEQENVNAARESVNIEKSNLNQIQAELVQANAQLISANAELRQAQAQYQEAQADLARSKAESQANKADIKNQEAQVKLAKINIDRSKMLVEGGAVAQQDLDDRTRDLDTQLAQLDSTKESYNATLQVIEAGEKRLEQLEASIDQAKASIDQAKANQKGVKARIESQQASIYRAEAELGSVSQNLAFNTIKAPISGVVGVFNERKVGDVVNVGEVITTITNNNSLNLNISIPIEYRSRISLGLPVELVNEDGTAGARGSITYIAPLVNQDTQSIQTKASFPNSSNLKDSEYKKVKVIWNEKAGLLVPTTAITRLGGQKFVFVATQQDDQLISKQVPIQVGDIQGQSYQVISGLKQGDQIAVSRILDLKDGTPIADEKKLSSQKPAE